MSGKGFIPAALVCCAAFLALTCSSGGADKKVALKKIKKEPLTNGFLMAASCYSCHGPRGYSRGTIPSLSEKTPAAIEKAMLEFRNKKRPSTMMDRHARGYTPEQIKALSRHFGKN